MNKLPGKGKLNHKADFIAEVTYEVWEGAPRRGRIISGYDLTELYLRFSVEPLGLELEDGQRIHILLRNMDGFFDMGGLPGEV